MRKQPWLFLHCKRRLSQTFKEMLFSMKKFFSVAALLMVTVLTLVGCGGTADNGGNNKVLKVGSTIDFAPFEFQDETNKEYQGFDMDLIRAVAKEMGMTAEVQNIGFDGLIPALQAKNIDIVISGMTITDERKENVLFSEPYYDSGLTIVVRDGEESIKTFNDLAGRKVAVQIGTTSGDEVHKIAGVEVKEFNTVADCFMELKAMGVDAVVNDRPVNDYYISKSGATGVKELSERLTSESYGMAMTKSNTELQTKVNDALQKLKDNGEYQKIYEKWFGGVEK